MKNENQASLNLNFQMAGNNRHLKYFVIVNKESPYKAIRIVTGWTRIQCLRYLQGKIL